MNLKSLISLPQDDEDISPEQRDSAEYRELIFLKKLLREKVVEESNSLIPHIGYKVK